MNMKSIDSVKDLEAIYGRPGESSTVKEIDHLIPEYRAYIEASPFVALATAGPEGLDCSPRGDAKGFVRIHDERTVMLPDRAGNNRTDSLRNIVRDPRLALLFLVPGIGNCLRINGRAKVVIEPSLLASFAVEGRAPRSVRLRLSISSAHERWCAQPCGTPISMWSQTACRQQVRCWPQPVITAWAGRNMTGSGRNGRGRVFGRGLQYHFPVLLQAQHKKG